MTTELESKIHDILTEKQAKIIPENIRKGVQIFDVAGTFEGNNTDTQQNTRLFTNEEEMTTFLHTNYDDLAIGDKAVVYGEEQIMPCASGQWTQSLYLPETITLTEPITTNIPYTVRYKYSNGGGSGSSTIKTTGFILNYRLNMSMCEIEYTSEDGQVFTRGEVVISNRSSGNYGAWAWDETTNTLSIIDSTTSYFCYEASGGGSEILMQIFKYKTPMFDGLYEVVEYADPKVKQIAVSGTNYINGTMPSACEYAYIGVGETETSYNLFGIKSGTIDYMGKECITFSRIIQHVMQRHWNVFLTRYNY